MIYARKVLEKNNCIIYLGADIKCLDYHTPCSLVFKYAGTEYTISCGDVLLFRNRLKPYMQNPENIGQRSKPVFYSDEIDTYIYRKDTHIYLKITVHNDAAVIYELEITHNEISSLYKAIDLSWYNRTLPVYR